MTKKGIKAPVKVVEEKDPVKVVEEKAAPITKEFWKVKNNTAYFHVQRSTGSRIEAGETKELVVDEWLKAEIKAGLFIKV
jgi:hypothetical protein